MNHPSSLQCAQCGATLPASTQASIPCHFCGYMNYAPPAPAPAPPPPGPPAGGYGQPPMMPPWYGQQAGPPMGVYQPPMSAYGPPGGADKVNTAWILAFVSFFACGGLFAIPALVLASQAKSAKERGDFALAQAKAKQSINATIIVVGSLLALLAIGVVISIVASAVNGH